MTSRYWRNWLTLYVIAWTALWFWLGFGVGRDLMIHPEVVMPGCPVDPAGPPDAPQLPKKPARSKI